ncbi:MAG: tryptophan--tRNA ligase, partial [Clostridia bacterium]|nr:tryptophan--tRNA ligase [Clostridia bacterium]
SIMSKITEEGFESIEKRYENKGYGEFKKEVANIVADLLIDIQMKYKQYNNEEYLNAILTNGAKQAQIVANETFNRSAKALGLR